MLIFCFISNELKYHTRTIPRYASEFQSDLGQSTGKFIQVKSVRYHPGVSPAKNSINVKTQVDDGGTSGDTGCQIEKLVKNANRRYVESETNGGPPQRDCTSRIYRPFGRESVILWTQMRRCLRAEHLSRVSCKRKGTGAAADPILFMRADDALFATRPSQVNIDSRPDWWTFLACVFRPRSTHLCFHPARLAYPYFSSLPLLCLSISSCPVVSIC